MFSLLRSLLSDEEGASLVEYGLLIALIALVAITAVQLLGNNINSLFNNVGSSI
ncbi:MAG: Flp family type IVb pilin [Candidatus Cybelea sp.]|jgi:pilus assembly protein Flp/PilA